MTRHVELMVTKDAMSLGECASRMIIAELERNPSLLFCTASGSTPTKTYQALAAECKETPELFEKIRVIKLDEWGGIDMSLPSSCESYLQEHIVKPLRVDASRYFSCQSNPQSARDECLKFDQIMKDEGPIDICLLGLGLNGHLGFNEPAEELQPFWHMAQLSKKSLAHPMAKDMDPQPAFGMTMGMASILASKKILLLVEGQHKQVILKTLMSQKITTSFPASFLWMHPNVRVICDQAAAVDR